MKEKIEIGDIVTACFSDGQEISGVVKEVSQEIGQYWVIEQKSSNNPFRKGNIVYINPFVSTLEMIGKMEKYN